MTAEAIGAIITSAVAAGAILIYVGRSLQTLKIINENQKVIFDFVKEYGKDIAQIKVDLTEVKTRQADCNNCP